MLEKLFRVHEYVNALSNIKKECMYGLKHIKRTVNNI